MFFFQKSFFSIKIITIFRRPTNLRRPRHSASLLCLLVDNAALAAARCECEPAGDASFQTLTTGTSDPMIRLYAHGRLTVYFHNHCTLAPTSVSHCNGHYYQKTSSVTAVVS